MYGLGTRKVSGGVKLYPIGTAEPRLCGEEMQRAQCQLEAQLAALAIYCVRRIGLCECRVLC